MGEQFGEGDLEHFANVAHVSDEASIVVVIAHSIGELGYFGVSKMAAESVRGIVSLLKTCFEF